MVLALLAGSDATGTRKLCSESLDALPEDGPTGGHHGTSQAAETAFVKRSRRATARFNRYLKRLDMQRGKQKAEARGARSELSAAASDDPISEGWEDGEVELEIDVLNDKAKGVGLLEWWEHKQCQHSQFMGLGYGVTVPQYVARHAFTGRPKPRLSGELRAARRARREAQLEEGETYYLGFEAFGMDEACDGTKMAAFL